MKCTICHVDIEGTMIGAGDGDGQEFAHPYCYYRAKYEAALQEIQRLKEDVGRHSEEVGALVSFVLKAYRDPTLLKKVVVLQEGFPLVDVRLVREALK